MDRHLFNPRCSSNSSSVVYLWRPQVDVSLNVMHHASIPHRPPLTPQVTFRPPPLGPLSTCQVLSCRFDDYTRTAKLEQQLQERRRDSTGVHGAALDSKLEELTCPAATCETGCRMYTELGNPPISRLWGGFLFNCTQCNLRISPTSLTQSRSFQAAITRAQKARLNRGHFGVSNVLCSADARRKSGIGSKTSYSTTPRSPTPTRRCTAGSSAADDVVLAKIPWRAFSAMLVRSKEFQGRKSCSPWSSHGHLFGSLGLPPSPKTHPYRCFPPKSLLGRLQFEELAVSIKDQSLLSARQVLEV